MVKQDKTGIDNKQRKTLINKYIYTLIDNIQYNIPV